MTHVTEARAHSEGERAIISHLNALAPLDDVEQARLLGGIGHFREWRPNQVLIAPGAELTEPVFIVSGWAGRARSLMDGRRQVIDFYIPGDLMGFTSRASSRAKAQYVCLTHVTTADVRDLVRIVRDDAAGNARLTTALARVEDEIEQGLTNQIVRAGAMSAQERMMHWLWEMLGRHRRAGLATGDVFSMPLTQEAVGDALGLSTVHVNRILQQLRRERIVAGRAGRIEILNAELILERLGLKV